MPYEEGYSDEFDVPPPSAPPPGVSPPLYREIKTVLEEWRERAHEVATQKEDETRGGSCAAKALHRAHKQDNKELHTLVSASGSRARQKKAFAKMKISSSRDGGMACRKRPDGALCSYITEHCTHLRPGSDDWCALNVGNATELALLGGPAMVTRSISGVKCAPYLQRVWDEAKTRGEGGEAFSSFAWRRVQERARAMSVKSARNTLRG
jgi:hypothetical protein